jgi:hypothetical protein
VVSKRRVRPCRREALAGGDQLQFDQLKRREWQVAKSFQYLLTDLHQFDILQSGSEDRRDNIEPGWHHVTRAQMRSDPST